MDFGAHESSALAGLYVLELDDGVDAAIHLEGHAVSKIACGYHILTTSKFFLFFYCTGFFPGMQAISWEFPPITGR
ncbi:MAG: hypothetical protein ACLULM_01455 [Acutalibacter sp.]